MSDKREIQTVDLDILHKLGSDSNNVLMELINNIPGGLGIFNVYPDGRMEQKFFNDGYYTAIRAKREDRSEYLGFNIVKVIFPEDVQRVRTEIIQTIKEKRDAEVELRILCGDRQYRWFNLRGRIASKEGDAHMMYVTYANIDNLKKTQLNLFNNQKGIEFARGSENISLWTYDMDERMIIQSMTENGAMGYPIYIKNVPEYFYENQLVHEDDLEVFRKVYDDMLQGAEEREATYRLKSLETGKYDWIHMFYRRIESDETNHRLAVGFSVNVNLQQENLERYQAEQELRRKLFSSYLLFYQMNLTTYEVTEYHNLQNNQDKRFQVPCKMDGSQRDIILDQVQEEFRADVIATLFPEGVLERFQQGETSVSMEYRRLGDDREYHWVRGSAIVMANPVSAEILAYVYVQDIDLEKKRALAYANVMKEEIESIILLNVKTKQLFFALENEVWNGKRQGDIFTYQSDFKSILLKNIVDEDVQKCSEFMDLPSLIQGLETREVSSHTYRIKSADGQILRKIVRVMYLDKYKEDIIFSRKDITDLYKEEQKKKEILEKAIDDAKAANIAKSDFLSNMSHDMRTPLNAIIGLTSKELTEGTTAKEKQEYLDKVHESGQYLLGIINDVLDMSKIENQKLSLRVTRLAIDEFEQMIQTVIGEQCKQKRIKFVFDRSKMNAAYMYTDKTRFTQIFMNLLSNAVKFTPKGGAIEFTVEEIKHDESTVTYEFVVRDNGIGMSESFIPIAFESFSQEIRPDGPQNARGTGLGLAIVKNLVDLMDGTIELESRLGKGTTFKVHLTQEIKRDDKIEGSVKPEKSSLIGRRILLLEDHPLNTQIAVLLLEKKQCIVETATDGIKGYHMFKDSKIGYYDAILMDIRMPGMDGIETTKAIRAMDRDDAKRIPIIAMTANAFDEDVERSKEAGMVEHIAKPIEPALLYATLEHYLR